MSKIMIVDDEWAEREGMKYLIAKTGLGLEIEDAPNGAAALERLQQGAEIDILMTDIEMPFMDGLELCLRARELRPEMKTVIFSVPFPVSWTVKMKKKQKETQDILSYHTQAAGCSDKARAKASGGRQPIEECGRTGL